jgi:hypothetical protein
MQAAEYRERLKEGVEVAAEAIDSAASSNGARAAGDGKLPAVRSENGATRPAGEPTTSAA